LLCGPGSSKPTPAPVSSWSAWYALVKLGMRRLGKKKQGHKTHAHTFTSLGDELMHLMCVLFVYGLGNRAQLQD
jgi:hypothetical protein